MRLLFHSVTPFVAIMSIVPSFTVNVDALSSASIHHASLAMLTDIMVPATIATAATASLLQIMFISKSVIVYI